MAHAFSARLLRRHEVAYHRCPACGLLQTEEPYWLDEAYGDAIAVADTGLVQRNIRMATKLAPIILSCLDPKGTYVDVAGGYGLLVRLMRDLGFDFLWEDRYCENLLARGFEANDAARDIAAVTAIEVLEHVHDPVDFIAEALARFKTRTFVFTTELHEGDAPPPLDWWYYAFDTGQHISFFQRRTLEAIAARLNLNFVSVRGVHLLTDKPPRHAGLARAMTSKFISPLAAFFAWKLRSKTMADHVMLTSRERTG